MDSSYLLPCPSCGGRAQLDYRGQEEQEPEARVYCGACSLTTWWRSVGGADGADSAVGVWQSLPRRTDPLPRREAKPATPQHEWDPPYHKAADQPWRCLRCGCRTHRPQDAPPCSGVQPPLRDPDHISSPQCLADEVWRLNAHIVNLNAHVRALETRRG